MSKVVSSSDSDSGAWSISVKAVGGEHLPQNEEGGFAERDFNVTVSPDDELSSLYEQIEGVTGLKASQQRLIYRGRLIGATSTPQPTPPPPILPLTPVGSRENTDGTVTSIENIEAASNSPAAEKHKMQKIKDIVGLGDGQTIHLVKKRDTPQAERPRDEATVGAGATVGENAPSEQGSPAPMAGNGTASLLAALLGLGSLEEGGGGAGGSGSSGDEPSENNNESRSWRANRYGNRRRMHYRLSEEDIRDVPDPGSAEPVRQSMMTLHTLLPHAQQGTTTGTSETHEQQQDQQLQSPLDFQRRWYRGQWVDCRDTVNQWLEATVVEIIHPNDILPPHRGSSSRPTASQSPTINPANDPAVSAGDLEGRRRLLLEPCMEGSSNDLGGELAGFRPRATNDGAQMILLHYNGWPHRWDEWIRSDSERLRPFRVRTRHSTRSTHASPTPQTLFNEAPSTFIRSEVETQDREALLPELGRILTAVNELVAHAAASARPLAQEASPCDDLPWTSCQQQGDHEHGEEDDENDDDLEELASVDSPARSAEVASVEGARPPSYPGLNRRELETLAPLLDRLGRTLIDAAPHVASLAASLPDHNQAEEGTETDDVPELEPVDEHPSTLGGLLSLLSRDRRRASTTSSSQLVIAGDNASAITPSVQTGGTSALSVDPDYTDFVTGLVNTSRGEVRAGPRSLRASQNTGDDLSNVLGAYLAAASMGGGGDTEGGDDNGNSQGLGRLLRERGNGGGIDIHIHAVVTAPGGLPGGIGLATLGGSPPTTAGNVFSHNRDRRSNGPLLRLRAPAVLQEEDDNGIFSALYSENPTPINPNQSPSDRNRQGDSSRLNDAGTQDTRRRLVRSRSSAAALSHGAPRSSRGSGASSRRSSARTSSSRGMLNRFFRRSNHGE
jgi:hypothetical protein